MDLVYFNQNVISLRNFQDIKHFRQELLVFKRLVTQTCLSKIMIMRRKYKSTDEAPLL